MSKRSDYQTYFPAAIHEPMALGKVEPDEYKPVTVKFNDGAIWVLRALVRQESGYFVVYTEQNCCHVFNAECVKEVL